MDAENRTDSFVLADSVGQQKHEHLAV